MSNAEDTLIKLEGVTKVFVTEDVETHALAGIHLKSRRGVRLRSPGRRAAANRRC